MAFGDFATLIDDFNRGNQTPPSSSWSQSIVASNGGLSIIDNYLRGTNIAGICSGWYNAVTPDADVESFITLVTTTTVNYRIYARVTSPGTASSSGYFVQFTFGSTTNIFRLVNASATSIGSATISWSDGDKMGIRCVGSTIEAFRFDGATWTSIISATDANLSGPGFCGLGGNGLVSSGGMIMDDFYMGSITAAAAFTPKVIVF